MATPRPGPAFPGQCWRLVAVSTRPACTCAVRPPPRSRYHGRRTRRRGNASHSGGMSFSPTAANLPTSAMRLLRQRPTASCADSGWRNFAIPLAEETGAAPTRPSFPAEFLAGLGQPSRSGRWSWMAMASPFSPDRSRSIDLILFQPAAVARLRGASRCSRRAALADSVRPDGGAAN